MLRSLTMKTLILGFDSGTFEIIDSFIKQNKLPNLSYLISIIFNQK